uniref:HTH psq-type domain-containing protein n=1 Tax=Magnetococcus massalia (strain MO-1) TaxID=451514 RepID=A0A1S7LHX4_MAGMO|nr:conserved protein of unknown function [Candidatus Magnetococcus massalia]
MRKSKNYSPEFRAEAVKLILEQGLSLEIASQRLSIPKSTLSTWVKAAKKGGVTMPGGRSVSELEDQIRLLRKELNQVRQERDVLKKATENSISQCNTF